MKNTAKRIPAGKIAAGVVYASSLAASYIVGKGIGMIPGLLPVKLLASAFVGGVLGEAGGRAFVRLWNSDWNIDIETQTEIPCPANGFNADGTSEEAERTSEGLIKEAAESEPKDNASPLSGEA